MFARVAHDKHNHGAIVQIARQAQGRRAIRAA